MYRASLANAKICLKRLPEIKQTGKNFSLFQIPSLNLVFYLSHFQAEAFSSLLKQIGKLTQKEVSAKVTGIF